MRYHIGMADGTANPVQTELAPCPHCAYDLRGHPDSTRCPECGRLVVVSAAIGEVARWLDVRLLDLWSISVLQTVGFAAALLTHVAIRGGHYVALVLGLYAMICISVATTWFLAVSPGIVRRSRRPFVRSLRLRRVSQVRRWAVVDACLIVAAPLLIYLLAR